MIKNPLFLVVLATLLIVAGCESTPVPERPLSVSPQAVTTVPYQVGESGLLVVPVSLNGEGPFNFIVDTGATISILFESTVRTLGISPNPDETTIVHGIIASSEQPVTFLPRIDVGEITRENLRVAILEDRQTEGQIAGIIGVDIMRDYALVFDAVAQNLIFYRPQGFDSSVVENWRLLPLKTNPYSEQDIGLFFLTMKLSGYPVQAIFDLGSSLSIVNWTAAQNPSLRRYRRRLQENWEMEGAVGAFEPSVLVRFETVRARTYTWEEWDLYVTDMETTNIIGAADQPLMIAGADMFRDTSFAVDFSTQRLWIKSTSLHKRERNRDRPMTGTRTKANTGAIGVFDGIDR